MALTNFPFGVTSFGIPVLSGDTSVTTGTAWFVDSVTGSASNDGKTPATPFASISSAITAVTASKGDTVFCLPGHTEAVTAAGTLTLSKIGMRLVGLGWGRLRAIITYTTAAAASFDVTAANIRIENMVFRGVGVASVTSMINVKTAANDVQFLNCEFEHANVTNQALTAITTDATADGLVIRDCYFHGNATTTQGSTAAINLVGGDRIHIVNCEFTGAYHATSGIINQATTACTNLKVDNCSFVNQTTVSSKCIVFASTCAGSAITNCRFSMLSGTAYATAASGVYWTGPNYANAAVGTVGALA